jgi:predicted dienelactone hydrolase
MTSDSRRSLVRLIVLFLTAASSWTASDARAGRWRFDPSDGPGAYAVGHSSFEVVDATRGDRSVPIEVWYPVGPENARGMPSFYVFPLYGLIEPGVLSAVSFDDAEPTATLGFPLVVYSHGWGGAPVEAGTLMESLASHGFVVAAPSHVGSNLDGTADPAEVFRYDRPLDVSFVIDAMLARNLDPLDPLFVRINPRQIGVAGFSCGGWTATAVVSGHSEPGIGDVPSDPRVRAVAAIAPRCEIGYQGPPAELAAVDVPLFTIAGTLDTQAVAMTTELSNLATGRPLYRAELPGGWHRHFSWQCDAAESLIASGVFSEAQAARLFNAISFTETFYTVCRSAVLPIPEAKRIRDFYVTAFFQRHLLGDPRYGHYLTTDWAAGYEPSVMFTRKDVGEP